MMFAHLLLVIVGLLCCCHCLPAACRFWVTKPKSRRCAKASQRKTMENQEKPATQRKQKTEHRTQNRTQRLKYLLHASLALPFCWLNIKWDLSAKGPLADICCSCCCCVTVQWCVKHTHTYTYTHLHTYTRTESRPKHAQFMCQHPITLPIEHRFSVWDMCELASPRGRGRGRGRASAAVGTALIQIKIV